MKKKKYEKIRTQKHSWDVSKMTLILLHFTPTRCTQSASFETLQT